MAIKDQCSQCSMYDGTLCKELNKQPTFDQMSCSNYVKSQIDLEKHSTKEMQDQNEGDVDVSNLNEINSKTITSEYLKSTTKIRGWLLFFLVVVVIGGIVGFSYSIFACNLEEYGNNIAFALCDIIPSLMLCVLAFMTIYSFRARKRNAVFLAKTYVVAIFVSNILVLLSGELEPVGLGSLKHVVKGLCWSTTWFMYLCKSKQVQTIIPKEYRKVTSFDYWFVTLLISIPLILIAIGVSLNKSNQQKEIEKFLEETVLQDDELTDGKMVFKVPSGFIHQKEESEGFVVYTLEGDDASIVICSDFDADQSEANINDYWKNWRNEDLEQISSELIYNKKKTINNLTQYYKVVKYSSEDVCLYWRFSMIFDSTSSKVCVISSYDGGVDTYLDKIISSIRFK